MDSSVKSAKDSKAASKEHWTRLFVDDSSGVQRAACACGIAFRFAVSQAGGLAFEPVEGGDPRRCKALVDETSERTGIDRLHFLTAIEIAIRDRILVDHRAVSSSQVEETGLSGVGVTRLAQNPDHAPASTGTKALSDDSQRLEQELDDLLGANLPIFHRGRVMPERCLCGAERHRETCELCRDTKPKGTRFDRSVTRWLDMGAPDDRAYRSRFGCTCLCHHRTTESSTTSARIDGLCLCLAPGGDELRCVELRTRRLVSGLQAKPLPGVLKAVRTPGLLPHWEPIRPPEGPARQGAVFSCSCACHAGSPDACECPENEKGPPGESRMRPKLAVQKRRRLCAEAQPFPEAIPDPCACACHVAGCCKRDDGERLDHADRGTLFGSCPCEEHDARACSIRALGPRVLANKVDTLHLSFRLRLEQGCRAGCHEAHEHRKAFIETLRELRQKAKDDRREFVTVSVGGVPWKVEPSGGVIFGYRLTNEYATLMISAVRSGPGVQVRFEVRSSFLWERELEGAWAWCEAQAKELHKGQGVPKAVLTRLDMAVDVTGVDFTRAKRKEFVCRARNKTTHFAHASAGDTCPECDGAGVCRCCEGVGKLGEDALAALQSQLSRHASSLKRSGLVFGTTTKVRIYDKTREIRDKSKDKKWLYLCWAQRGWVATETVWRVEVEIHRQTLNEFVGERTLQKLDLDELEGLRGSLSSLWGYVVGGKHGHTAWLKWCKEEQEDQRRARWDAKDEWKIIQGYPTTSRTRIGTDWSRAESFEVVRVKAKEAKFWQLVPQFAGLARAMAATTGPMRVVVEESLFQGKEREPVLVEPRPGDFERYVDQYLVARDATWHELVNEARVERNLEKVEIVTDEEQTARRRRAAEYEIRKRAKRSRQKAEAGE